MTKDEAKRLLLRRLSETPSGVATRRLRDALGPDHLASPGRPVKHLTQRANVLLRELETEGLVRGQQDRVGSKRWWTITEAGVARAWSKETEQQMKPEELARLRADDDASATDDLVDRFAVALKEKLRAAEAKYGYNDGWLRNDWQDDLVADLLVHVRKGDPRDVAAYCAFAWHHGWSVARDTDNWSKPATPPALADGLEVVGWGMIKDGRARSLSLKPYHPGFAEMMAEDCGEYAEPLVLKSAADARDAEQRAEIERLRGLLEEAREGLNVILLQSEDCLSVRDEIITEHASHVLTKIGEPR